MLLTVNPEYIIFCQKIMLMNLHYASCNNSTKDHLITIHYAQNYAGMIHQSLPLNALLKIYFDFNF